MKTLLLISPYWREHHRWMVSSVKLAGLFQKMGYRVVTVCMGRKDSKNAWKNNVEQVSETLTIHRVPDLFFPDPLNYGIAPTFLFHVLRVLKNEKPDIVIVNKVLFWSSLVTPILRLMGKKPIVTTDALVGMTWWPRAMLPKIIMAIGAWTFGWLVLLSAKNIVFFHPQPKALLKFLGIAGKSRVIPTGVDTEKYARHAEPVEAHHESITVTYIGRLESVKGVDDFLGAAVPLKKRFPELTIQVVGWSREKHPLVERFKDDVIFTGLRDDIPQILQETDIFVLPSYSEGLSNALMEAMASGCACIATRVGGNAYLLEEGISGLLFTPGDRTQLRKHLEILLSDEPLLRSLGKAARKRIEERFSSAAVMREYATLFADAERR